MITKNMIKIDFRPLEYIEIVTDKPLIIKLDDKWIFKCYLQMADCYIKFNDNKNLIFNNLDALNKQENSQAVYNTKILYFKLLIKLLYEISKFNYPEPEKERNKLKINKNIRMQYEKFLFEYLMQDVDKLFEITKIVLEYNTALKKKQDCLMKTNPFETKSSDTLTFGGILLKDLIKMDDQGNKYFLN